MFTYETADQKEVRRFRIAQFNGRTATVKSGDSTITGLVRSVLEKESSVPPRWTITIVPSQPKTKSGACGRRRASAPSRTITADERARRPRASTADLIPHFKQRLEFHWERSCALAAEPEGGDYLKICASAVRRRFGRRHRTSGS